MLDSDDEEDKKCKLEHNTALAMNTKMHNIHDKLEHLSDLDKEKIEEMEKQYDPKSEDVFKEVWDLSDTSEDKSMVKNLDEELSKLTVQDSDNSESSAETVIEAEKREISPEKEKCEKFPESDASLSPIPGGQESSILHSLGMVSKTKLHSSTGIENSKSFPQTLSRKYKYRTQVKHEEDCACPYCYIRKSSKKQKLSFSSTQQRWSKHSETRNVHHQDQQRAQQRYQPSQRRW